MTNVITLSKKSATEKLIHKRCSCTTEKLFDAAKSSVGISNDYLAFRLLDAIAEMEQNIFNRELTATMFR